MGLRTALVTQPGDIDATLKRMMAGMLAGGAASAGPCLVEVVVEDGFAKNA